MSTFVGRRLYLNPQKELTINPKKFKKSPLSIHHTTQLCNFYIGPDDQPKKIKKKIKKKSPLSMHHTTQLLIVGRAAADDYT